MQKEDILLKGDVIGTIIEVRRSNILHSLNKEPTFMVGSIVKVSNVGDGEHIKNYCKKDDYLSIMSDRIDTSKLIELEPEELVDEKITINRFILVVDAFLILGKIIKENHVEDELIDSVGILSEQAKSLKENNNNKIIYN